MSWFTIAGIKEEIRKIHWPSRKELSSNTVIAISFILFFVVYFLFTEIVSIEALKLLGIGG
ncbi:preprotein translocase subunit SecE [Erysipelothrix sp. D19-032]|uniref:preprotein translocase subunit SecE n=1 Tax=Erysipelothrix TaxID=1647 RepID=UPI00135AB870|nr:MULTISPECIES: preprotein translocase subunit SecE [Erysipelothrix]QIK87011.1 preprotein translocase subunit SecE [Erysipelothrix sp. HDW6B]